MDLMDRVFCTNKDWDPTYLQYIFSQDFYEFRELWHNWIGDNELVKAVEKVEREPYKPIVEDISMDDNTLYTAVEQIEKE